MTRILVEKSPWEIRAACFDDDENPFGFFQWAHAAFDPRVRCGEVHQAIIRRLDKSNGHGFVELQSGEVGFFNFTAGKSELFEGQSVTVEILAEAYGDKSARVKLVRRDIHSFNGNEALDHWLEPLRRFEAKLSETECVNDTQTLDGVLEEAQSQFQTLEGGGRVYIETTHALTAIDVDLTGVKSASASSNLNERAASLITRQVALRSIGGLVVIDFAGSPNRNKSEELRYLIRDGFKHYGIGGVDVLPVSRLGVMEIAIPRRARPLHFMKDGSFSDTVLSALRALKRVLLECRSDQFRLSCSGKVFEQFNVTKAVWYDFMAKQFGHRFEIVQNNELTLNHYELRKVGQ